MKPKVSIIIPVYNGSNYLQQAIDSALAQTYENIEIVVVNDGSDDNKATREVALRYGDRIRYFEKENGGTSSALNYGIQRMTGEYFAWLSHDDVYLPERIKRHMDAILESGDKLAPVYSKYVRWIDSKELYAPNQSYNYDIKLYQSGLTAVVLGLIDGLSLTFHKSYFDENGLFDESLRTTQDYMKWFEMFHGKRMIYLDEHLAKNRVHEEQQGRRISTVWEKESDKLYSRVMGEFRDEDLAASGMDLYTFLGLAVLRFESLGRYGAAKIAETRLLNVEVSDGQEQRKKLQEVIKPQRETITLYCIGKRGRALLKGLYLRGIKVDYISDKSSQLDYTNTYGATVIRPEDIPYDSKVIITKDRPDEIVDEFIQKGYRNVSTYDEIINSVMMTPIDKCKL
ncbi:glycosyltransferase family 2 protein [Pseudobutyrivibrio xylanivorans]|uniref:Glycosyltransferase involved in cell wall bisynthesis n=1 Tax=Pseudobutyrivibrio xylanivorans DSM 14809 TaxID=1123012 RepID=A0A1M6DA87_PSEXY|nr:glycosyltransferase family A protein [Pseudobutyrivibrio xylanivorans]SHI70133.1 Glycosyltransferase involved in cell wall bisynthesis [Pseudobutyrivibrio xylanivorans DSM 14809]